MLFFIKLHKYLAFYSEVDFYSQLHIQLVFLHESIQLNICLA